MHPTPLRTADATSVCDCVWVCVSERANKLVFHNLA